MRHGAKSPPPTIIHHERAVEAPALPPIPIGQGCIIDNNNVYQELQVPRSSNNGATIKVHTPSGTLLVKGTGGGVTTPVMGTPRGGSSPAHLHNTSYRPLEHADI